MASIRVNQCHFPALTIQPTLLAAPLPAAADPEPKEDFCIADRLSRVHVNGYVCKDRSKVSNEDFVY